MSQYKNPDKRDKKDSRIGKRINLCSFRKHNSLTLVFEEIIFLIFMSIK